jgi:hypothetical protein
MRRALFLLAVAFLFVAPLAGAQTFSSGSTGADGPLNPTTEEGGCVSEGYYACWIQVPESGILNYTTITTANWTVRLKMNSRNTPVYVLATGTVSIGASNGAGGLFVSAAGRVPGPGGFYGGNAQYRNGFGPGGGTATSLPGRWVGSVSLVPIVGGSGGGYVSTDSGPYDGGGGGGALVIASSSTITIDGVVGADGGGADGSISGSGGAIRIVANHIAASASSRLYARGGAGSTSNPGLIRLEAPAGSLTFLGGSSPAALLSDINPVLQPTTTTPALLFVSMGGHAFPTGLYSGGNNDTVDLMLPAALQDPIPLVVNAANIPVGTQLAVTATGSAITSTGGVLAGTLASSSATLQISGLVRTSQSHLFVHAVFDVPGGGGAGSANPAGPDQVASVRLESELGGASSFQFLRADGSVVPSARLRPEFLAYFKR